MSVGLKASHFDQPDGIGIAAMALWTHLMLPGCPVRLSIDNIVSHELAQIIIMIVI